MPLTRIRQDTQIRKSDLYDDTVPAGAALESASTSVETDLNALRSQMNRALSAAGGNWYDDLVTPSALDPGVQRGVNDINDDLHALERKRVLVAPSVLVTVTVGAGNNYVILPGPSLPPVTTAAIGVVTTLGTVAAYVAGFGTHSLNEVAGPNALTPKNLCRVVASPSRDPILSGDRVVYALLQSESNTDGSTFTATTPNRVQLSFVRINAAGNDLEAVSVADIQGLTVSYLPVERKALLDLLESDLLLGAVFDVDAGAGGGGITPTQHEDLDTLVHNLAENSYDEYVYTGPRLTRITTWTSPAKILKIRESTFAYTGSNLTTSVTKQYDGVGVLLTTLTKTFTYSGSNLVDIVTVRT